MTDLFRNPILVWIFGLFLVVAWSRLVWQRIYRLARYFQLEGYDGKRYLRWLLARRQEQIYIAVNILSVVVPVALADLVFTRLLAQPASDPAASAGAVLTAAGVMIIIITIVSYVLLPREKQIQQKFTPTSRAVRLLATAIIADVVITLVLGGGVLTILLTGPAALLIAPLMLPLANIINWPIEEVFRQYYLGLAKRNLKRCGATVIAITGSYGKTSTKHYLSHILEGRFRVLMTPKSYNTLLGISRVINEILAGDNSYDYFIAEAGAYIPGEIARICKLVEPTISLVVTVGPMHLERFGSIENVVKAKYEIIEALPPDGTAVFNADDPRVLGMAERGYPQNRILITKAGGASARLAAENVRMTESGLSFDVRDSVTGEQVTMQTPLFGEHNVTNILLAAGVAVHLEMTLKEIGLRVATLQPAEHRLNRRVMPDGTILIDDAYSANPVGTQTALQVLALQKAGRRVILSSGMFELGPISDEENRKLGERMAAVATDVVLIGPKQVEPVRQGLVSKGFPADHLHIVGTLNEAVEVYKGILRAGDALLVLTDLPDTYA